MLDYFQSITTYVVLYLHREFNYSGSISRVAYNFV